MCRTSSGWRRACAGRSPDVLRHVPVLCQPLASERQVLDPFARRARGVVRGGRTTSASASARTAAARCPGGRRRVDAVGARSARAHVVFARPVGGQRRGERRRAARGRRAAAGPASRADRGQHEDMAADHCRDGVSRQADHRRAAQPPGHQRFARPHRDLVEGAAPSRIRPATCADQVVVADRGAADGHDQVRALGQLEGRRERGGGVAGDRQQPRLGARRASTIAFSPKPFEAMIWSGPRPRPACTSSSPVGDQRHDGAAAHGHGRRCSSRPAARGRRGRSRRGARACGARGEIGAGGADVRPVVERRRSVIASPSRVTSSWITTRSAPVGHRRAGEDAHRLARADACREGACPAAASPMTREARAGARRRRSHRVAVHRRGGEGRLRRGAAVTGRGQHPARGLGQRHVLGPERRRRARRRAPAPRRRRSSGRLVAAGLAAVLQHAGGCRRSPCPSRPP